MGLNDKRNNENNSQPANSAMSDALRGAAANRNTTQPQESAMGQNNNAAPRGGNRRGSGFTNINQRLRRDIGRNGSGEVLNKFNEALTKTAKESLQGFGDRYLLIPVEAEPNLLACSGLALVMIQKTGADVLASVHTVLLAESASKLSPVQLDTPQGKLELARVPGDMYDDFYWAKVQTAIKTALGNDALVMIDANASVLPVEVSIEDVAQLQNVLLNAVNAVFMYMNLATEGGLEDPLTIQDITHMGNLTVGVAFNAPASETATGLPRRSDINITLNSNVDGQGQVASRTAVCSVDGYMDLTYVPAQPPKRDQWGQVIPEPQRHYVPRFVMTNVSSETDAVTMELQLLALVNALVITQGNAWFNAFKPRALRKGIDLRDIGAINYELNLTDPTGKETPKKIDTKANTFDTSALHQLISTTMYLDPIFSMDIEESGELSWLQYAFLTAASGDINARNVIIAAADNLTGNRFSQIFDNSQALTHDEQVRVQLGYYYDEEGVQRDIRDIDYLAILNYVGSNEPQAIVNWSDTFDQKDVPAAKRAYDRQVLLAHLTSDRFELKGYADRITFTSAFLTALSSAVVQAGLVVRPENLQAAYVQNVRGDASALSFAMGQVNGNLFSYGANNNNVYGGAGMGYAGPRRSNWG